MSITLVKETQKRVEFTISYETKTQPNSAFLSLYIIRPMNMSFNEFSRGSNICKRSVVKPTWLSHINRKASLRRHEQLKD